MTTINAQGRTLSIPNQPAIPKADKDGNIPQEQMLAYQQKMDQRTQMISFITNLLKSQHEASMAVIRNVG